MFRIDKEFAGANIPKTIRFTEELDAKLHALERGGPLLLHGLGGGETPH